MTAEQRSRRNTIYALLAVAVAMVVTFIRSPEFDRLIERLIGG